MNGKFIFSHFLSIVLLLVLLLVAAFFLPWKRINWGQLQLTPGKTITVVGEAKTQEKNQVASFTAGVSAVKDNKDEAVEEVNSKVETLIESVKNFGIDSEDIKTQNLSVHQAEETYHEDGVQKKRPGQWRVNNSITITLRDVDRTSELTDLLSKSGATNVYGPNFRLEETEETKDNLLSEAVENAREKAKKMAQTSGGKLGKIISITEGYQSGTLRISALEGRGGGGAPVEPGTSTVQKTVTVIFELN